MRLLRAVAILILCFGAAPIYSQGSDVVAWIAWPELDNQSFDGSELEYDSSVGFGVSANWFWWDRFSTELSVMALEADVRVPVGIEEFDFGKLDMTPVMVTFQFHLSPDSTFDPYLGLGAAYVLIDDLHSTDLDLLDIGPIEIDDEFTYLVNAGVGIAITPNFGIHLDARYLPLEPASRALNDPDDVDLELNPLILSAGFRLRFGP